MPNYLLDPSGVLASNFISSEIHNVVPPSSGPYSLVIPNSGPFYSATVVVRANLTARSNTSYPLNALITLTKWVDYIPVYLFTEATSMSGQPVHAGILLLDKAMRGVIQIDYHALGGDYQLTDGQSAILAAASATNPITDDFSTALGLTAVFASQDIPVKTYPRTIITPVRAALTTEATTMSAMLPLSSPLELTTHISDTNNPHGDTAATYHLENVPNWATATPTQAALGTSRNLFVTPKGAAQAVTVRTNVPIATDTTPGTVTLNVGATDADAADNSKVLTAAGLLALKNSAGTNAIKSLFNTARQQLFFSPLPLTYPCFCLGTSCQNFLDLVSAVCAYTGLTNIQSSASLACIWLPYDYPTAGLNLNTQAFFGFAEGGGAPFGVGLFNK